MLNFGNKEFRNLQEQVLKNAQDIETLKSRENLQIVIVEELPEEGNPNYIYLVPNDEGEGTNVYEEYVWLAEDETYEKIGAIDIDLTNYVTLGSEQTITGVKKFQTSFYLTDNWFIHESSSGIFFLENVGQNAGLKFERDKLFSQVPNYTNLGTTSNRFKNAYFSGVIDFGNNAIITKDSSNRVVIQFNSVDKVKVGETVTYFATGAEPTASNTYDLGSSTYCWKDAYIAGNISDGINSISVVNIASKVTSSYASGTFDANGEDTVDISGGTPEGLFIFTYGNCQCFVRLTATMVQNADAVPIEVSCPMIHNNTTELGWFKIERSGTTLTVSVTDGNNHVDSGYSWTLVKTNLI